MDIPSAERIDALFEARREKTFKVVLVYEDLTAGKRGNCFYETLADPVHSECELIYKLWSFDVLFMPKVRNSAATAAAAADVVILSMSGRKPLSSEVRKWIEMWIWLIDRKRPALFALFDHPGAESVAIQAHLQAAISDKHLDLYSYPLFPAAGTSTFFGQPETPAEETVSIRKSGALDSCPRTKSHLAGPRSHNRIRGQE